MFIKMRLLPPTYRVCFHHARCRLDHRELAKANRRLVKHFVDFRFIRFWDEREKKKFSCFFNSTPIPLFQLVFVSFLIKLEPTYDQTASRRKPVNNNIIRVNVMFFW